MWKVLKCILFNQLQNGFLLATTKLVVSPGNSFKVEGSRARRFVALKWCVVPLPSSVCDHAIACRKFLIVLCFMYFHLHHAWFQKKNNWLFKWILDVLKKSHAHLISYNFTRHLAHRTLKLNCFSWNINNGLLVRLVVGISVKISYKREMNGISSFIRIFYLRLFFRDFFNPWFDFSFDILSCVIWHFISKLQ